MIKKLISIIYPSVIYISVIYPFTGLNAVNYFAKLSLLDVWMGTWLLLSITPPLTITPKLVCHLSRREFMKSELPWWILKICFPSFSLLKWNFHLKHICFQLIYPEISLSINVQLLVLNLDEDGLISEMSLFTQTSLANHLRKVILVLFIFHCLFSKWEQICSFQWIRSHLLKKPLTEKLIFIAGLRP